MPSRRSLLLVLIVISTAIILMAGLNPKGFQHGNGVSWIADGNGIRFDGLGLAYTNELNLTDASAPATSPDFRLSFEATPAPHPEHRGFTHIITVYSGSRETQFLIGQWREQIVVMNGDDYDYSQRHPRLSAPIGDSASPPASILFEVNGEGSFLSVDGTLVSSIPERLILAPPSAQSQLLIGNSASATYPWRGDVKAFALAWKPSPSQDQTTHRIQYLFDEGEGQRAMDAAAGAHHLLMPTHSTLLEPEFFTLDAGSGIYRLAVRDWIINIVGFVPFGAVLAALLLVNRRTTTGAIIAVAFAALLLSGSIELLQAWLPTRTSSLPDLLLNIFGAIAGASATALWYRTRLRALGRGYTNADKHCRPSPPS